MASERVVRGYILELKYNDSVTIVGKYMHACIHTYTHTYIHTYIHKCIQTNMYTNADRAVYIKKYILT